MQLFANISRCFAKKSTSNLIQDAESHPDIHGLSELKEPAPTSGVRNSDLALDPGVCVVQKPSKSSVSSSSTRRSRLTTGSIPMLEKRRRVDASSDERRLFPNYSRSRDEVPIIRGGTFKKQEKSSLQSLARLKVVDTISHNRKESGPVRASGKTIQKANYQSHAHLPLSSPTLVDSEDRPVKRQRRGMSAAVIDLVEDEDTPQPRSITSSRVHRLSDASSQASARFKKADLRQTVDEYREVEKLFSSRPKNNSSLDSPRKQNYLSRHPVISGTSEKQLRSPFSETSSYFAGSPTSKHAVLESVEISNPSNKPQPVSSASSPSLQRQFVPTDGERRTCDMRESPDELQGDATVQRAPSFLTVPKRGSTPVGALKRSEKVIKKGTRRNSPSDIQQTLFNPSITSQTKRPYKNKRPGRSHRRLFEARSYRLGDNRIDMSEGRINIVFDSGSDTIGLEKDGESNDGQAIPARRVAQVFQGADLCRKVRLKLSSTAGSFDREMDIEFQSEQDKIEFCNLLDTKGVNVQTKEGSWMDKAFDNFKTVEPGRKRPSTDTAPDTALEVQPDQVKRQKLSASLQSDGDETNIGLKQPPRRLPMSLKKDETPDPSTHSRPLQKDDEGVEIPVKKFHAPAQGRETRSQALRGTVDLVNDGEQNPASSPNLKDVSTHLQKCSDPKWSKPLIYPRQGKKKAEVDSYDLERLRDGEFLNDNLIGFYLRFLEHHLERTTPELAKRVYFFNSYFFATLTNMTKGKRGINYEGVQKWTRNVDLFSHDYVIVPINESAHWYLAIICNLTSLEQKNEDTIELEPVPESVVSQTLAHRAEIPETPPTDAVLSGKEIAASSREEKTRESFASMTLSEVVPNSQPTERSDDEWPEKEENPTSSPAKFSPHPREPSTEMKGTKSLEKKESTQKGKRQKRKGHVLSIDQPTIITFDSLGATRFPAVKALRSYLLEEAASKRSLDLDPKDIKSMTAKEIPLQPNFWDCGLYLLAYLEKFVQDPDQFARKLLQKEMSAEKDWPTLTSGLLRRRLRDFLFELREEQDGAKYEKILADVVPISYLLGPPQEPEVIPDSMPDPTEKILENAAEISDSAPDLTQVQEQPTTPEDKRIKNGSKIDAEGGTLEKSATGAPEVEAMVHRPTDDRDIVEVEHEPPATPQYKVVESPDKGAGATLSYNGHTTRSSPRVTRRTKPQETPSPKTTGRLQTTEDTRWMDELHSYITNDTPETRESSRVKVEIQVPSTPPSASTSDIVAETPRHNLRQAKSRKDDH